MGAHNSSIAARMHNTLISPSEGSKTTLERRYAYSPTIVISHFARKTSKQFFMLRPDLLLGFFLVHSRREYGRALVNYFKSLKSALPSRNARTNISRKFAREETRVKLQLSKTGAANILIRKLFRGHARKFVNML